jgi:hypothetical protein
LCGGYDHGDGGTCSYGSLAEETDLWDTVRNVFGGQAENERSLRLLEPEMRSLFWFPIRLVRSCRRCCSVVSCVVSEKF